MSSIYLKVTTEKRWRTRKFFSRSVVGELQLGDLLLQLQRSGSNTECLLYYFDSKSNYDVLKSKQPSFLLNKNINCGRNKQLKLENLM